MVSDPLSLSPALCLIPCFPTFELPASHCELPLPGVMFFPTRSLGCLHPLRLGVGIVQGFGALGWQEGGKAIQAEGPVKG